MSWLESLGALVPGYRGGGDGRGVRWQCGSAEGGLILRMLLSVIITSDTTAIITIISAPTAIISTNNKCS